MKNCKTFWKVQTASHLKENIQSPHIPPPHQIKPYCVSGTKFSLGDIEKYPDICFQSASRMHSWALRNGAVQIFFLTPNRNMFPGKFVKSERFLAVLREHIVFNVK